MRPCASISCKIGDDKTRARKEDFPAMKTLPYDKAKIEEIAKTHPTPHFLPFFNFIGCIFQRTYLEHIRIVPAFFECRMRKNETHRAIHAQQPFFVFHNQIEPTFFVLTFIILGIHVYAFFIHGKITVMNVVTLVSRV